MFRSLLPALMARAAGAAAATLIVAPSAAMAIIRLRAVAGMTEQQALAVGAAVVEVEAGVAAAVASGAKRKKLLRKSASRDERGTENGYATDIH